MYRHGGNMTALFLSADEVSDLTGYKLPAKQAEWLADRRYLHELDANGRPKVLRSHLMARLGGAELSEPEPQLRLG